MSESFVLLAAAIFTVALLYSSVGHAGASGYIAVLTLCGVAVGTIRPTALALNILVAAIATFQFWRAGHFRWSLFWPFVLLSAPAAFLGGWVQMPAHYLKLLLGVVLWLSALRLLLRRVDPADPVPPGLPAALATGAGIGFLSGLTGTGGGIFLTPLLVFCRWAKLREAAAISAPFILANSIFGLAGYARGMGTVPDLAWPLAVVAAAGGLLGSRFGSRHAPVRIISLLLAAVLVLAGAKLLFG